MTQVPKRIKRLLKIASNAAKLSEHARHKMAAVGVAKSGSVFVGIPQKRTHPAAREYPEYTKTLHAEFMLWNHAHGRLTDIVVARVNKGGFFALAKPCRACQEILRTAYPKARIYYTAKCGIEKLN